MKAWAKLGGAALFTALPLLILYLAKGLYPFGENTVSWCDMSQQVVPLLCAFQDAVKGDGSLFFSFSFAGGMNMWGVWAFFLASPFTLLTLLVEKAQMAQFMNILLLLKMMACALSMCWFLHRKYPRLSPCFGMLLSVSYAFCGYTLLFYQNIVWLDVMALFPLLWLSFLHLMERGEILPYVICLSAMAAIQFYLGFMLAVFLILAAFLWMVLAADPPERGRAALRFLSASFCAACLSAVIWLPSLLQVAASARGENIVTSLQSGDFLTHAPTVGMHFLCTAAVLPAFFYGAVQLVRGRLSRRERVVPILFGALLLSLIIEPVNKMWHTGSYQAFPGRYGFMAVFLGLLLAACALQKKERTAVFARSSPVPSVILLCLSAALPVWGWLLQKRWGDDLAAYAGSLWGTHQSLIASLRFFLPAALLFSLGLWLFCKDKIGRRTMTACLAALVFTESLFFGSSYLVSRSDYTLRSVMAMENAIDDDGVYRVKNLHKNYDLNLTGGAGMASLNQYTSLTRKNTMENLRKMGFSGYWMEIGSVGGDQMADAMVGHKYTVRKADDPGAEPIWQQGPLAIEENPLTLPMGLLCTDEIFSFDDRARTRPYYNEDMLRLLCGSDETVVRQLLPQWEENITLSHNGDLTQLIRADSSRPGVLEYTIPPSDTVRTVYFDCFSSTENNLNEPYYHSLSIFVNGECITDDYPTQKENGILQLAVQDGQPLQIRVEVKKDLSVRSFGLFVLEQDALSRAIDRAKGVDLRLGGRSVSASVTAEEGEWLALMLPFDEGWSARINGEKVPVQEGLGGWMALSLQTGENEIRLQYTPPGFWAGFVMTLLGLVLTAVFRRLLTDRKAQTAGLEKAAFLGLILLFAAVASLLFFVPPLIWILL